MIKEVYNKFKECLSLKEFDKGFNKFTYMKCVFVREKSRMHKGINESNTIRYPIQFILIIAIFVKQYMIGLPDWVYIVMGIGGLFALWFIGLMWDVVSLYQEENEFANRRNKFVGEMREWKKE